MPEVSSLDSTVSIAEPFELHLTSLITNLNDLKNKDLINQKLGPEVTSYDLETMQNQNLMLLLIRIMEHVLKYRILSISQPT